MNASKNLTQSGEILSEDLNRDRFDGGATRRIIVIGPYAPGDGSVSGIMLERIYGAIPGTELVGIFADDRKLFAPGPSRDGSRFRSLLKVASAPLLQLQATLKKALRADAVVEKIEATGGCVLVVGVTGAVSSMSLAAEVAKRLGVPFVAHIFDDCVYQWMNPLSRVIARRLAVKSLRQAVVVAVHNEILAAAMTKLAGVDTVTLRNPVPDHIPADKILTGSRSGDGEDDDGNGKKVRLLYTGNIYDAQFGAIRTFVEAVEMLATKGLAIQFDIYTRMPKSRWSSLGIVSGAVNVYETVTVEKALELQRSADLLALPLSFSSRYPRPLIDSSAPGKFGEYLASGTPMLIHAPPTSFPSVYCRKNRCGIVADRDDAAAVAAEIERFILGAGDFADEMVANATRLPAEEFTQSKVAQKAAETLAPFLTGDLDEKSIHP